MGPSRIVVVASAVLASAALAACVEPPAEDDVGELATAQAIFGGTVVTSGPIASSTVMFVPQGGDGTHGCSASIIDASHALTAAHCTFGLTQADRPDLVFAPVVAPGAPRRTVTAFATPTTGFTLDIAVLTFTGGVPLGYTPVAVARAGFALTTNVSELVHAGYGQTTSAVNDRGTLHQVASTFRGTLSNRRYLASKPGAAVCSGDSGGPDYVTRSATLVQIGVHVSGDCAGSASSSDVRQFNDFILSTGARPTLFP